MTMANNEFLPLCDVLFNIISLLWYFCNIVFDIIFSYALYSHHKFVWFCASLSCVIVSLVINQIVSLRCYLKTLQYKLVMGSRYELFKRFLILLIHIALCGVLWRYLKLFIPVDVRYVKNEVRDLCMLRLIHAFCEAAPLLLMQLYLLLKGSGDKELGDLILVSFVLSLFSMCWALASFSKNVRLQNVHRLVFTWLGVIFQLLWRLGTVGSRISALTLYATLYGKWLFLVLGLHWMSMFFWLISPKNVFHGEKISKQKKAILSFLIAFIYIFSYINLQEVNHKQKMVAFYVVMLLENILLVAVWLAGVWPNFNFLVPVFILVSFFAGICFMGLYYRVFHVRRLSYWSNERNESCDYPVNNSSTTRWASKSVQGSENAKQLNDLNKLLGQNFSVNYHEKIPGVFNCRFSSPYTNNAGKRKKKKPTTFVPPPSITILPSSNNSNINYANIQHKNLGNEECEDSFNDNGVSEGGGRCVPFWKQPLPRNTQGVEHSSLENDYTNTGTRINIKHKLQEKKEKQLAELKVIEEEIKQGKIERSGLNIANVPQSSLQPIPRTKRHTDSFVLHHSKPSLKNTPLRGFTYHLLSPPARWQHSRTNTPEILLAPHFLDDNNWGMLKENEYSVSDEERSGRESIRTPKGVRKSYKNLSDVDSQISYTLPREFRYDKGQGKKNAQVKQHFIRSTNSSDGDVDSAEESTTQKSPVARKKLRQFPHRQVMHETQL